VWGSKRCLSDEEENKGKDYGFGEERSMRCGGLMGWMDRIDAFQVDTPLSSVDLRRASTRRVCLPLRAISA